MGSLLAIHTPPAGGPTRTPLQNILETSSLVHHKNPAVEGPVVSFNLLCYIFHSYQTLKVIELSLTIASQHVRVQELTYSIQSKHWYKRKKNIPELKKCGKVLFQWKVDLKKREGTCSYQYTSLHYQKNQDYIFYPFLYMWTHKFILRMRMNRSIPASLCRHLEAKNSVIYLPIDKVIQHFYNFDLSYLKFYNSC